MEARAFADYLAPLLLPPLPLPPSSPSPQILPVHQAGHILDLIFCPEQGDWQVADLVITPLSQTNHFPSTEGGGSIRKTRPWRRMDPGGFLNALGEFPGSMAGDSADSITSLWYQEACRALDAIAPESWSTERGSPVGLLRNSAWWSRGEAARERPKSEGNRTLARAHYLANAVMHQQGRGLLIETALTGSY